MSIRTSASCLFALAGLACCAPGGTPAADAGDSCRPQFVVFSDTAGGIEPVIGIAPGRRQDWGPPLQDDTAARLQRENADIERLQIGFDALLYCRWIELRSLRADFTAGRTGRPATQAKLAAAARRLRAELAVAQRTAARLEERGIGLETAAERAVPGTRAALARQRARRDAPLNAIAATTVVLRLRPDPAAPEVGRVPAGRGVTLRPASNGFALITPGEGLQGYAPGGAFNLEAREPPEVAGTPTDLRTLAAGNIARRDNFRESVELAESSLLTGGFEAAF